ncbi:MAG: hypothetical protein EBS83_11505 [Planctomycetia bacterium]|nr:hypothetical protein [Planctomycetia bacterium]
MLLSLGLDAVVVLDTNAGLLGLSPADFYELVLRKCLRGAAFVEGDDFRFGAGRQGDTEQLRAWASRDGLACAAVSPVVTDGIAVSSSRIRQLLSNGEAAAAAEVLGTAYAISGRVEHGQHRGAAIGFPTANLTDLATLLPAAGVYAGQATTVAGSQHAAAIHIGKNLTFAAARPRHFRHPCSGISLQGASMRLDWAAFLKLVHQSERFVLTSHVRPDCDALGSELGLLGILEAIGKDVRIVNAQETPANLRWIDPENRLESLAQGVKPADLDDRDLLVVLDTSAWAQLGAMGEVLKRNRDRVVVVDHHVSEDDLADRWFKDTTAEATARIVYEIGLRLRVPLPVGQWRNLSGRRPARRCRCQPVFHLSRTL